ncbi:MAG TPA: hypothetical protein VIY73_26295, partial [Polyangiaceae bacterium]
MARRLLGGGRASGPQEFRVVTSERGKDEEHEEHEGRGDVCSRGAPGPPCLPYRALPHGRGLDERGVRGAGGSVLDGHGERVGEVKRAALPVLRDLRAAA